MENERVILERHEQRIQTLERDMRDMQDIRSELKTMSESLVALATEMKHTNEHLVRNEEKIDLIESRPHLRLQQIATAIISALTGVLITAMAGALLG